MLPVEQRYSYSENSLSSKSATYAKDNLPTVYQLYDDRYAVYEYDSINRLNQRMFNLKNTPLYYNYIYKSSDRNGTGESLYRTHQISKEFIGNDVYVYGYDVLGNITSIKKAVRKSTVPTEADFKEYIEKTDYVTYTYDKLGQLTRENNITSNKTTVWDYDELGNITAKKEYSYTTEDLKNKTATKTIAYDYDNDSESGWENLLISVDLDGDGVGDNDEISYDKIGNPTTYLGATLKWNGRQLTNYTEDDTAVSYKYDADGLRTSKTVNGVTSKYFYVNGQLHYEERTDGTKLYFFYDSNGYLSAIEYNGTNYYPATNKRGDVVAIYRYTGDLYAKYEYDAWGNVISVKNASGNPITSSTHIANVNPIRYRGYYYDAETKLYYLQSRYYNPDVGRFLNADGYITTDIDEPLAYNMFAYCGNNPVMYSDPSGCFWEAFITAFSQCLRQAAPVFAGAGAATQVDSPLLGPADVFAATVAIGTVLVCATVATYRTIKTPAISIPKVEEKEKEATITPSSSTTIYRYGGTNPGNLTPKEKDRFTGLSFSTKPAPGAAKTTIEELNATGVVRAYRDGPTHVSVRPVGGTMDDWIEQGSDSVWTQAVKSTVVKWDGY